MENNNKDFLRNRPGAGIENLNKYQDNFGSAKDSTISFLTILLSIIMIVCAVVFFVKGRLLFGFIFTAIFLALFVSTIVAENRRSLLEKTKDKNSTEAIFKDHEE